MRTPIDSQPDATVRAEVERRLAAIEAEHGVDIFLAIESGSRAWGFPSPDSDYDVRFLYVRPLDEYLSLDRRRDVIETPIEGPWDVNGWDIRKALGLLRNGNAVTIEWLVSPIVYRDRGDLGRLLRGLAARLFQPQFCVRHYAGQLRSQFNRDLAGRERVRLKSYFYSIRAAAALAWVRAYETPPPMALPDLWRPELYPAGVEAEVKRLFELKSRSNELGEGPRLAGVDALIAEMLAWAADRPAEPAVEQSALLDVETERLFLRAVGR